MSSSNEHDVNEVESVDISYMSKRQLNDHFDEIISDRKLNRTEGESAIKNLNTICKDIGYQSDGFKYGSSLERFLQDNSGCVEAIHKWMAENLNQEQFDDLMNG